MRTYLNILTLVLATFILSGCFTKYHIRKNSKIYVYRESVDTAKVYEYSSDKKCSAREIKMKIEDDHIKISKLELKGLSATDSIGVKKYLRTNFRASYKNKPYFAEEDGFNQKAFKYTSTGLDFSVASMSVKNRFRIRDLDSAMVSDSFPSTNISAFTPTLAFGGSHSYHWTNKDFKKLSFEISGGVFAGFGTTDINNKTTRESIYQFSRKAVYLSYGAYVNLGLQKFDLGLAYGWDVATGPGSSGWLYQGAPFVGVMIGWDLVKFRE